MKKILGSTFIMMMLLAPMGCAANNAAQGSAFGGVAGAGLGAGIARATGGSGWTGALIGGAVGSIAGLIIGDTMDQRDRGNYYQPPAKEAPEYQKGYQPAK